MGFCGWYGVFLRGFKMSIRRFFSWNISTYNGTCIHVRAWLFILKKDHYSSYQWILTERTTNETKFSFSKIQSYTRVHS